VAGYIRDKCPASGTEPESGIGLEWIIKTGYYLLTYTNYTKKLVELMQKQVTLCDNMTITLQYIDK